VYFVPRRRSKPVGAHTLRVLIIEAVTLSPEHRGCLLDDILVAWHRSSRERTRLATLTLLHGKALASTSIKASLITVSRPFVSEQTMQLPVASAAMSPEQSVLLCLVINREHGTVGKVFEPEVRSEQLPAVSESLQYTLPVRLMNLVVIWV